VKPEIVEFPGISVNISSITNKRSTNTLDVDPLLDICKILERMLSTKQICEQLRIISTLHKQIAWKLNFDIMILNDAGNLLDAIAFGCWISMKYLKIPNIIVEEIENSFDYQVGDEQDMISLDISTVPILLTIFAVGKKLVIDCNSTEEFCSDSLVHVGVKSDGTIVFIQKAGQKGLSNDLLVEIVRLAPELSSSVFKSIQ
jgi:exosome complex RNA-binding protein Rrp42 (RNase PH superfamily)